MMIGKRTTLLLSVVLVLLAGLIIVGFTPVLATFASDLLAPDDPVEDEQLVMEPHPGPNGEYASVNETGKIEIVADELNPTAQSNFSDVFTIWNNASSTAVVNISHDNEAVVVFDSNATEEFGDIQTEVGIVLEPDETVAVGFHIDAAKTYAGQTLLEEVSFHAAWTGEPDTTDQESIDETPTVEPRDDRETPQETPDTDDDDSTAGDEPETEDDATDDEADEPTPGSVTADDAENEASNGEIAGFSGFAGIFLVVLLLLVLAATYVVRRGM